MVSKIKYELLSVDGGFNVNRTTFDENHNFISSEDFETVHATEAAAIEEMEETGRIEYENLIEAGSGSTDTEIVYNRVV